MHTARLLTVSPSMQCAGGWGVVSALFAGGGVPGPCGVCSLGVSTWGVPGLGVRSGARECLVLGMSAAGVVCSRVPGGGIPAGTEADHSLCGQNS